VPVASAGTYSIVDIEWVPANSPGVGTNGGYIYFGIASQNENPLDLYYGLSSSVGAPWFTSAGMGPPQGHTSMTSVPSAMGLFRWKVQWVGAAGEAHPGYVSGTVEYKGSSVVTASCFDYNLPVNSFAQITDPFYSCYVKAAASTPGTQDNPPPEYGLYNGANFVTIGSSEFMYVSGTTNTYVGYFNESVNSAGSLQANGALGDGGEGIAGVASSNATMNVIMRLTQVAGQQVQPNL